jgi:hypothetical protein
MKKSYQNAMILLVVTSMFVISFSACHHRKRAPRGEVMMTGYSAREYRDVSLNKIYVQARVQHAYFRDQIERRLVTSIKEQSRNNVQVVMGLDMFPPLREYSEKEIEQAINNEKFDAVLFVNVSDSNVAVVSGWGFSGNSYGASGGTYTKSSRLTNVTAEMYDPRNKNIMWKSQGNIEVRGSKQSSFDDTAKLISIRVARMMEEAGFIDAPPVVKPARAPWIEQ